MNAPESYKIILFDGVCNLCNSSVNFVINHDPKKRFKFAALQSEVGQKLILDYEIDTTKTDSIILIDNNKAYVKSTAALRIAKYLNRGYPLFYVFIILWKLIIQIYIS